MKNYQNDCVIWFKLPNWGGTYFVGNGFKFIEVTKDSTITDIELNAKQYNGRSQNRMFKLVDKKAKELFGTYPTEIHCSSLSLHFRKYNVSKFSNKLLL